MGGLGGLAGTGIGTGVFAGRVAASFGSSLLGLTSSASSNNSSSGTSSPAAAAWELRATVGVTPQRLRTVVLEVLLSHHAAATTASSSAATGQ